jgi:D-3-phosphoglycerate dehydrogenase
MQVLVTDYSFESLDTEKAILQPLGAEVVGRRCRTPEELIPLVGDADAILTQFAPVNAAVIGAMKKTRVIVRYGIGVDNVDLEAARARGIPVCNVPDYCINEVADHTLALILALTRQVVANTVHLRSGKWGGATPLTSLHALSDLSVGVVAFGRIGREVASRLRAFKCKVLAFDPVVSAADIEKAGCTPVSFDQLVRTADVVTLHCPSTPATRRLINRDSLGKMKRGALLINVARGDVVETPALIEALQSGQLGGAALDVYDPEPIPAGSPLCGMANVILTPHNASASPPAAERLRTTVANIAARALRGEALINVVNGVKK